MNKPIDDVTDDIAAIKTILEGDTSKKTFFEDLRKLMIAHGVVKITATDMDARIDLNDYIFCKNLFFEFGKQEVRNE